MFVRQWEQQPAVWAIGRTATGTVFYLKVIGDPGRARATLVQPFYGCVDTMTPSKPVTEAALIRKFLAEGWPVGGRLVDYENRTPCQT